MPSASSGDRFFDRKGPINIGGLDDGKKHSGILLHIGGVRANSPLVDGNLERAPADRAVDGQLKRPTPRRRFIRRLPLHAHRACIARKGLRLGVALPGPRSELPPLDLAFYRLASGWGP